MAGDYFVVVSFNYLAETGRHLDFWNALSASLFSKDMRATNLTSLTIEKYLQQIVRIQKQGRKNNYAYISLEDFVLKHGKTYTYKNKPRHIKWGKQRECFKNAFHLAEAFPNDFTYVEGFAHNLIPGVHHAWCIDKDGNVIDNTWREGKGNNIRQYIGVPFSNEFVWIVIIKKGSYGIFEEWSDVRKELMTNPFDEQEFIKGNK